MARKRSHILQKVSSNLLKISIFIAKLRKPIIPRLISLKKSSKLMKNKFKLVKHYNYGYIQEYQFSPSSTPLIPFYQRKQVKKRSNVQDIYSIPFLLCSSTCFGGLRAHDSNNYPLDHLEALPVAIHEVAVATGEFFELSDSGGEDDSVDERAERFIERFYEEMRKQRRESFPQLMNGLLES